MESLIKDYREWLARATLAAQMHTAGESDDRCIVGGFLEGLVAATKKFDALVEQHEEFNRLRDEYERHLQEMEETTRAEQAYDDWVNERHY